MNNTTVRMGHSGLDAPRAPTKLVDTGPVRMCHSGAPSATTSLGGQIGIGAACIFGGVLALIVWGSAGVTPDPDPSLALSRGSGCVTSDEFQRAARRLADRQFGNASGDLPLLEVGLVRREMMIRERDACLDLKALWSINPLWKGSIQ